MAGHLITRREISLKAILDLLDPQTRAKLDALIEAIRALPVDEAIVIEMDDVERRLPEKQLPRLPPAAREPEPSPQRLRLPQLQFEPRPRRAMNLDYRRRKALRDGTPLSPFQAIFQKHALEILEIMEEGEWIGINEIARIVGRKTQSVSTTMNSLMKTDLFKERRAPVEGLIRPERQFYLVRGRMKRYMERIEAFKAAETLSPLTLSGGDVDPG